MNPDFQKLIEQFESTERINFLNHIRTWQISPDQTFYEIMTNQGTYYVFEVDYIGNFTKDILEVLKGELGNEIEVLKVKTPLIFEEAEPVKRAQIYIKPKDWEEIAQYAGDKFGSYQFYFNFLIKTIG